MTDISARPGAPAKPRPSPIAVTEPFWEGLRHEQVLLPRCHDCDAWIWYPRARCPACLSDRLAWHAVSGEGVVHTFTVARQATHPAFADEAPQLLAVVELPEGVRLTTTLVEVDPGDIRVGLPVVPVFDKGDDGITLLRYRPALGAPPPSGGQD